MRLISAEEIESLFNAQIEQGATDLFDAFDDALQDAQTVDAVPVVRCKDCTHLYGKLCTVCGLLPRKPDDFCSYGERKDGADSDADGSM